MNTVMYNLKKYKSIKTDEQYEDSLERIFELMQKVIKPNSKYSDELELLSILVKNYEDEKYPIEKPNPIEAIKFRLEQMGVKESYLSNNMENKKNNLIK